MSENFSSCSSSVTGIQYIREWNNLFHDEFYLAKLKVKGVKGELRDSYFRSICWRVFLKCFPEDPVKWADVTNDMRQKYECILDKLQVNPWHTASGMDLGVNNPLSQCNESPWNQYFQDGELKLAIQQDVVRTFPEIKFFQSPEIQKMMINILFCYAREYPALSYRQGMHELLAPIIYVLHRDQEIYLKVAETEHIPLDICILLNQNYTEHDAFFLFSQLMIAVEGWYVVENHGQHWDSSVHEPFSQLLDDSDGNTLGIKLTKIYENYLRHHDIELFYHLDQMEIAPQIYGIRWLRLLFGREFSVQDLLVIWDAIFASSLSSDLVEYIFIAMLIHIRDLLLHSDYTSCLSILMHYPDVENVMCVIDLALHLKDPAEYSKPTGSHFNIEHVKSKTNSSKLQSSVNAKKTETMSTHHISRPNLLTLQHSNNVLPYESLEEAHEVLETDIPISNTPDDKILDYDVKCRISEDFSQSLPRSFMFDGCEGDTDSSFKNKKIWHSLRWKSQVADVSKNYISKEMFPIEHNIDQLIKNVDGNMCSLNLENSMDICAHSAKLYQLQSLNKYCCNQLTIHLDKLKINLANEPVQEKHDILISLAELGKVSDLLCKSVNFMAEVLDHHIPCNLVQSHSEFEGNDNKIGNESLEGSHCSRTKCEFKPSDVEEKPNLSKESKPSVGSFSEARKGLRKFLSNSNSSSDFKKEL